MELEILHRFESLHNPVANAVMYGITLLGNKGGFWIALSLAMLLLFPRRYKKIGLTVAIALVFSLIICNGLMKNLCQRVRPFNIDTTFENLFGIFGEIHDWSFPSGHTSASFASAVAIILWSKKEGAVALVLAFLIALSRLYLTVHYPSDVGVSLILGSFYGWVSFMLVKYLFKRFPKVDVFFNKEA